MRRRAPAGSIALALALLVGALAGCNPVREGESREVAALDTIPGTSWTERDWAVLIEKVQWAAAQGLDTVPLGTAMAELGRTFVGTTYTPGTLEAPGAEHLVINLRELDCVTFIENVWALNRFLRSEGTAALADPPMARAAYEAHLRTIRYRDGVLDGYSSRLHYFSDWLWNHEDRGHLGLVTAALGGVPDPEPLHFMSSHRDAYRQLADPALFAAAQERERALTARGPRIVLPQESIAGVESRIRDGDIIAATSTLDGLDIAHTGLALHIDGRQHQRLDRLPAQAELVVGGVTEGAVVRVPAGHVERQLLGERNIGDEEFAMLGLLRAHVVAAMLELDPIGADRGGTRGKWIRAHCRDAADAGRSESGKNRFEPAICHQSALVDDEMQPLARAAIGLRAVAWGTGFLLGNIQGGRGYPGVGPSLPLDIRGPTHTDLPSRQSNGGACGQPRPRGG